MSNVVPLNRKIEILMTPKSFSMLSDMASSLLVSKIEVIKKSVSLFNMLMSEVSKGSEVQLLRYNGEVLCLNSLVNPETPHEFDI